MSQQQRQATEQFWLQAPRQSASDSRQQQGPASFGSYTDVTRNVFFATGGLDRAATTSQVFPLDARGNLDAASFVTQSAVELVQQLPIGTAFDPDIRCQNTYEQRTITERQRLAALTSATSTEPQQQQSHHHRSTGSDGAASLADHSTVHHRTAAENHPAYRLMMDRKMPAYVRRSVDSLVHHTGRVNQALAKWGPLSFHDPEAISFHAQVTEAIVEQRQGFTALNRTVQLPTHVPDEARSYAAPKHGLEWEMFDGARHLNFDAVQDMKRRDEQREKTSELRVNQDKSKFFRDVSPAGSPSNQDPPRSSSQPQGGETGVQASGAPDHPRGGSRTVGQPPSLTAGGASSSAYQFAAAMASTAADCGVKDVTASLVKGGEGSLEINDLQGAGRARLCDPQDPTEPLHSRLSMLAEREAQGDVIRQRGGRWGAPQYRTAGQDEMLTADEPLLDNYHEQQRQRVRSGADSAASNLRREAEQCFPHRRTTEGQRGSAHLPGHHLHRDFWAVKEDPSLDTYSADIVRRDNGAGFAVVSLDDQARVAKSPAARFGPRFDAHGHLVLTAGQGEASRKLMSVDTSRSLLPVAPPSIPAAMRFQDDGSVASVLGTDISEPDLARRTYSAVIADQGSVKRFGGVANRVVEATVAMEQDKVQGRPDAGEASGAAAGGSLPRKNRMVAGHILLEPPTGSSSAGLSPLGGHHSDYTSSSTMLRDVGGDGGSWEERSAPSASASPRGLAGGYTSRSRFRETDPTEFVRRYDHRPMTVDGFTGEALESTSADAEGSHHTTKNVMALTDAKGPFKPRSELVSERLQRYRDMVQRKAAAAEAAAIEKATANLLKKSSGDNVKAVTETALDRIGRNVKHRAGRTHTPALAPFFLSGTSLFDRTEVSDDAPNCLTLDDVRAATVAIGAESIGHSDEAYARAGLAPRAVEVFLSSAPPSPKMRS